MRLLCWNVAVFGLCTLLYSGVSTEHVEYVAGHTKIVGLVTEHAGQRIHHFKGIPFAKPPIGDLRFRPPQPTNLENFNEINATQDYDSCVQSKPLVGFHGDPSSEDCLYLSIYIPEKIREKHLSEKTLFSVVIIIYGGGFMIGSSLLPAYDSLVLSAEQDLITVGFNYRLGVFGFLDFSTDEVPGNMGLMDQQAAIRWVKNHIAHFGGDPDKITIMGLSAGSMSVSAQILNPASRKLFKNAVMDGGTVGSLCEHSQQSLSRGLRIAEQLNCDSKGGITGIVECLKSKPAEEVLKAQEAVAKSWIVLFKPTYGSRFLPDKPNRLAKRVKENIPKIFVGTAKEEGTLFVSKDPPGESAAKPVIQNKVAAIKQINELIEGYGLTPVGDLDLYAKKLSAGIEDFMTDGLFVCAVLEFADEMSKVGAPVYLYQMNYFGNLDLFEGRRHAHHGVGFFYGMGFPLLLQKNGRTFPEDDLEVTKKMLDCVGDVAKNDRDSAPKYGGVPLEKYGHSRRRINVIQEDGTLVVEKHHDRDETCFRAWGYPAVPRAHDEL